MDTYPVIINAMNLGRYLDGIGVYTLNLIRELTRHRTGLRFIVYVNRSAACHVGDLAIPDHCHFRWVPDFVSPDRGFRGHFLRLLLSNLIGLIYPRSLILTASQLEAVFFRSNQIVMIHDIIPLLFRECHRKQYFYFRRMLPMVLRRVRAVITPSRHTKGLLEQVYGIEADRIRVIPNGVTVSAPSDSFLQSAPQRPFLLYAGRIVRMKNITGVIRAFGLLQERIPHDLVIVGHGRERLGRMFERSKLLECGVDPERVRFAGHVSFDALAGLLMTADALVFPSFYEGFGLPPLEAMKAGCPAIVSRVGSLPEVCGDAAYYFDPYDTGGMAAAIEAVVRNRPLRDLLIGRGIDRAAGFTWAGSFRKHLVLIAQVLQESSVQDHEGITHEIMSKPGVSQ